MNKQERIELLQDQVQHNRIEMDELEKECKQHDIDLFDDVIHPIGYNLCDRCGDYGDSELDLFWLDGFDWEDGNEKDQAILKALNKEHADYCAVCYKCLNELEEIGRNE